MKHTFYTDPGHGWLQVPTLELRDLGIAHLISRYSYIHPSAKWVYLEEDMDMTTYLVAKVLGIVPDDWKGASIVLDDSEKLDKIKAWYKANVEHDDRATLRGAPEIKIRNYPSFNPAAKPESHLIEQMAMAI